MSSNRISLDAAAALPAGEIAALPAEQLALLMEEAAEKLAAAKQTREQIEAGVHLRYGDRAASLRRAEDKDAGTVRFEDDGCTVVADLPKKVRWDQPALAAIVRRIAEAGEDPAEYVDTEYRVSERRYAAWPSHIRAAFAPARTVETGKATYRLTLP